MTPTESFPDDPQFRIFGFDGDEMILQLTHFVRVNTSLGTVIIPTGFLTDGLSIPSWAHAAVGPATGRAFLAGLLHDYLYSRASTAHFNVTREVADRLFLEAMYNIGIGWAKRHTIHAAVRVAGWKFFKQK